MTDLFDPFGRAAHGVGPCGVGFVSLLERAEHQDHQNDHPQREKDIGDHRVFGSELVQEVRGLMILYFSACRLWRIPTRLLRGKAGFFRVCVRSELQGSTPLFGKYLPIAHSIIGVWMMQGSSPLTMSQNRRTGNATISWRGSCAAGVSSRATSIPATGIAGHSSRAPVGRTRSHSRSPCHASQDHP